MGRSTGKNRRFLVLQGPHGPFFAQLAQHMRDTGAKVWRVGFNQGDRLFWPDGASFLPYRKTAEQWPDWIAQIYDDRNITDLVLYGDTRPIHAEAIAIAKTRGILVHVFEEGYLRPHWVTYERGGANGYSRLLETSLSEMQSALEKLDLELPAAPTRWGDLRQHVFYGFLYHAAVLLANRQYRHFRPHRALTVGQEFRLYLTRLMLMPVYALQRVIATQRVKYGGFPYHLVLLQLEHDASFQKHGPFANGTEFLEQCVKAFADGAESHHHLVFKAHPLEDGRVRQRTEMKKLAQKYGIEKRVHYIRGGKLAELLDHTRSVVTVNSTAAQQALWRGLPLKAFGQAVYSKPEFVSDQTLDLFFAAPQRPDSKAYRAYRHFLLETSQITGGFYASRARRRLLRQVIDMMLAPDDPYDALSRGTAHTRHHLRLVK